MLRLCSGLGTHITLGKSDPYVVFHLNGQRVYKSQTKKKTLNPEWNEPFTVQVVSRGISISELHSL